ncbi:MAG: molybdenum cofactor guanylyltransferase [Candidatus Sericytochromatia bacterium]
MFASIILAGGDSSRIGENKALLNINGKSLIENIIDKLKLISSKIYIVTNNRSDYEFLNNVELLEDYPSHNQSLSQINIPLLDINSYESSKNILNAIYTGLKESEYEYNFVCACDMPNLNIDLINEIFSYKNQYDCLVPVINYKPITLHTFYSKNCLEVIKSSLDKGNKVTRKIFRDLNTKYINDDILKNKDNELKSFFHIKTRLDYILSQS